MPWKDGLYEHFRCPVCRTERYVQVRVKKADGNWYLTSFYQCFGCSVMFADPVQFTKCETLLKPRPPGMGRIGKDAG